MPLHKAVSQPPFTHSNRVATDFLVFDLLCPLPEPVIVAEITVIVHVYSGLGLSPFRLMRAGLA